MKKLKQSFLLFMIIALVASCCGSVAFADNTDAYTITLQQKETDTKYTVDAIVPVQLILSENPGGTGATFVFDFDKDTLQYMGVVEYGILDESYHFDMDAGNGYTFCTDPSKPAYGMLRLDNKLMDKATLAPGGVVLTVGFKVLNAEAESSKYVVSLVDDRPTHVKFVYVYDPVKNAYNDNVTIIPCTLNVGGGSDTVAVEGVSLEQQTLTLTEGESATLTATVAPEDATNKNVTWTSDNEEVATVDNGTVTAVGAGTANITVTTEDGGHTAICAVTVNAKQPEVKTGYTVSLPADKTSIAAGESTSVDITVGVGTDDAETVTTYNAVDMQIRYDADKLTFNKDESAQYKASITDDNGIISLKRYGDDLSVGTDKFSLKFTAKDGATGEAAISIERANVGIATAADQDAPEATILNASHTISIEGYKVNLPENMSEISGNKMVTPNQTYTFTLNPLPNYDYAVTATVNDAEVPCTWDEATNTYSIDGQYVTGDITITVVRTGKVYNVTLDTNAQNAVLSSDKATYGTDYTFTVTKASGYVYDVYAMIDSAKVTGLTSTNNGNVYTYTVPGDKITGDMTVYSTRTSEVTPPTPSYFNVTWEGDALDDIANKADKAEQGKDFSFTINKADGYTYEVKATVGGADRIVSANGNTYTIDHINGDVVITVNKTLDAGMKVEVYQYVKQNGQDVYLITAKDAALEEGKLLTYDSESMFYSEQYGAYCYLVVSTERADTVKADAETKIAQADGEAVKILYNGDVNQTGKIDINDAQMTHNMYNSELYDSFAKATIRMYLEADVNGSKTIDVADATAIVSLIK